MLPSLVINLDDQPLRWAHVEREFPRIGLAPPRRLAADTGQVVPPGTARWSVDDCLADHWTRGEVGCLLSHMAAWRTLVDEGHEAAAVFEDDVVFGADAGAVLSALTFPAVPTMIKLESTFNPTAVARSPSRRLTDRTSLARRSSRGGGLCAQCRRGEGPASAPWRNAVARRYPALLAARASWRSRHPPGRSGVRDPARVSAVRATRRPDEERACRRALGKGACPPAYHDRAARGARSADRRRFAPSPCIALRAVDRAVSRHRRRAVYLQRIRVTVPMSRPSSPFRRPLRPGSAKA